MNLTQFAEWLIEAYHSDDGMPEAKEICREARAALSAQPVAGAVAQQDQQADALRFRWLCEHPDWHFIERLCREFVADSRMEFLAELRRVIDARRSVELGPFEEHVATPLHECAQPEPSAQAVAHPSHQTVREWMPVSEALRLSDLWTAGDLDNCGQWRAAIKVLADEVRALAASPQPAEPSAQGEPVAWISPKDRVPKGGEVVLCLFRDKGIHTALFRGTSTTHGVFEAWHGFLVADLPTDRVIGWVPLASAPSTPPPAVVEAVPPWTTVLMEQSTNAMLGNDLRKAMREAVESAQPNTCRKCGGVMKPGQAMGQTMNCSDEGTCSPSGPGYLMPCMKCEKCGWSVTGIAPKAAQEKT